MAKKTVVKKEKIVSALSIWRLFDISRTPETEVVRVEKDVETGLLYQQLRYNGRDTEDGGVRIFAYFARPQGDKPCPAILLLKEANKPLDVALMAHFVQKGYAVLMPDYSGKLAPEEKKGIYADGFDDESEEFGYETDEETPEQEEPETNNTDAESEDAGYEGTVYPPSLAYANYATAKGLYDLEGIAADQTCWFEWTYSALYSLSYLKSRDDIEKIGVVGIRTGGEVAWKVMLSPDVACGVPVNAAGWLSSRGTNRFAENSAINLADERHRYIAGVDSQSYAPFVTCPVLMLCAMSDYGFDADRAYDTFGRIGGEKAAQNAIIYSPDSGSCIGQNGLQDLQIFLEKHLKGREVFIPDPLNITVVEKDGKLLVEVSGDQEGIISEMGVCYTESAPKVRSIYREWQCVYKQPGNAIKNGKISCEITPFEGAPAAFLYGYAQYLNGFKVVTKIVPKQFNVSSAKKLGSRMLFSGEELDSFSVAEHEDYSVAGIFLETEATPKLILGYGGIQGAYSLGGIKTYKISSPRYVAEEEDILKFDAYVRGTETETLRIGVEVTEENGETSRYFCQVPVKGGGKWKRIMLEARDFKNDRYGKPLESFAQGRALTFGTENEDCEYAITNILWL